MEKNILSNTFKDKYVQFAKVGCGEDRCLKMQCQWMSFHSSVEGCQKTVETQSINVLFPS